MTPKSGVGLERFAGAFGGKRGTPATATIPFESWRTSIVKGATTVVSGSAPQASYTVDSGGDAHAIYVDKNGDAHAVTAGMTFKIDFGTRSGELTATEFAVPGTTATFDGTGLVGKFQIAAGENLFTGTVNSRNKSGVLTNLTGGLTGRFFGPAAQELGGIFDAKAPAGSDSPERLLGAFGAGR